MAGRAAIARLSRGFAQTVDSNCGRRGHALHDGGGVDHETRDLQCVQSSDSLVQKLRARPAIGFWHL